MTRRTSASLARSTSVTRSTTPLWRISRMVEARLAEHLAGLARGLGGNG